VEKGESTNKRAGARRLRRFTIRKVLDTRKSSAWWTLKRPEGRAPLAVHHSTSVFGLTADYAEGADGKEDLKIHFLSVSSALSAVMSSLVNALVLSASFLQKLPDEPVFNFLACPGRFTQERKTGLYARIELETPDRDATPHLAPTMPLNKLIENVLQRDAVQGIAGMGRRRCHVTIPALSGSHNHQCQLRA
jgi:hypothetical protein